MKIQEIYDHLAAIPDKKWTTGMWDVGDNIKCVLGHCGENKSILARSGYFKQTPLSKKFRGFVRTIGDYNGYGVNDGLFSSSSSYRDFSSSFLELGDTPKERVLNALVLVSANIFRGVK